jgi:Fungal specific transcription factor domain
MGTDTFTKAFNLPPCEDRIHSLELHRQLSIRTAGMLDPMILQTNQDWSLTPQFPSSAAEFEGSLGDFWTDPFQLGQQPALFALSLSWESQGSTFGTALSASLVQDLGSSDTHASDVGSGESLAQRAALLSSAMHSKLWCLRLEDTTREELSTCLSFLLAPDRLARFVSMYFQHWHPNAPLLHQGTFDPATIPTTLLAAVVFLGAMYTVEQIERLVTQRLIDVVELVVFDSDIFSHDIEVSKSIQADQISDDIDDWTTLQHLQAGYLMVVLQYWAGSRTSKHRAMETRFGEVIKVSPIYQETLRH